MHTPKKERFEIHKDAYLCVDDKGKVEGIFENLQKGMEETEITELGNRLLIPSFVDAHIHSSQLPNAGLGYDMPFPKWLVKLTYPTEEKYKEPKNYRMINKRLISEYFKYGVMHGVVMSSTDHEATADLFEQYIESGMCALIGKMNSDLPTYGTAAESTEQSIRETEKLIKTYANKTPHVNYAVSPEFVPTCSDELLEYLGNAVKVHRLPVITHAAEGAEDVKIVKERFPSLKTYGNVLRHFGLFGQTTAAGIHYNLATDEELTYMAEKGIIYVQCPNSGMDMGTERLLPIRRAMDKGVPCALGSDIAGGHTCNMFKVMVSAMQLSRIVSLYEPYEPLSTSEAFYLATKGGGKFFGETGSFEKGYYFNALVLDDTLIDPFLVEDPVNRLQKIIYKGDPVCIIGRFCRGKKIEKDDFSSAFI